MDVAILGCGPAGLLTAHAVALSGHRPRIFSINEKRVMPGAIYLHSAIEGITKETPDGEITLQKVGPQEGYAKKVYGNRNAPVSWTLWEQGVHPIWNLRRAYEKLWSLYSEAIHNIVINPLSINILKGQFPLIFSSIPAQALCLDLSRHHFKARKIWVIFSDLTVQGLSNVMIYNGEFDTPWYRHSSIFGFHAWEYGNDPRPRMTETMRNGNLQVAEGIKPLSTTCTCHTRSFDGQGAFVRVGRYGRWEKNVLTHHAFDHAKRVINAMQ